MSSPVFSPSDRIGSGSLTALNTTVTATTQSASSITFSVTGTWVGTITLQGLINTTWVTAFGQIIGGATLSTLTVTNQNIVISTAGFSQVRLTMTAYTSGTAAVDWSVGIGTQIMRVWNNTSSSLLARAQLYDSNANAITTTVVGAARGVDVNITSSSFSNLTGNATTTVKSGAGVLRTITINNNAAGGTATVYDNTAGSGTKIATIASGTLTNLAGPTFLQFNAAFATGLTVVTAGAAGNDYTITYN